MASGMELLACVMCRSRKLKCDRKKPACSRCLKDGGDCVYPESRRKPSFKRRNVKEIEARLAQLESYLKDVNKGIDECSTSSGSATGIHIDSNPSNPSIPDGSLTVESESLGADAESQKPATPGFTFTDFVPPPTEQENTFMGNGALMGLGYSETLPPFHIQEELNNTFFSIPYHFIPIIHINRFYQSFYAGPLRKPPMSLQYAIWAVAANGHAKYDQYAQVFYQRARQYIEADEMKDHGEHFITIAHAQALCLVAAFEAKCMLFTRASTTCAKSVRLCQMMGLDRLDGAREDLPPVLGPHTTWEELEERRRVFWGAFAIDSHASISTGWPTLINLDDIMTRLPASEESFTSGKEETAPFLNNVSSGADYGSFAGTIVVCQIFRTILKHVHRSKLTDHPEDMMGGLYWKRHRDLDNQLSSTFMFLPTRFRLPGALRDPAATHMNLNLHAAIIILHNAAIEKVQLHALPESVAQTSLCRLRTSAEEIVNIVKIACHSPASFNPVAGLTPSDISNFETIIQAMEAIGRNHDLTKAFLQQSYVDVQRNDLSHVLSFPNLEQCRELFTSPSKSCIPLITRSSISGHSKISSVLPGSLPLKDSIGKSGLTSSSDGTEALVRDLINADCFQPVLGAVTRNVGAGPRDRADQHNGETVPPGVVSSLGMMDTDTKDQTTNLVNQSVMFNTATNFDARESMSDAPFALPDRTNSTTSSPAYRPGGSDLLSGSSHTSSSITGLGNTPEENRVDLRAFQERVAPQIWQAAQMQSMQDSLFSSGLAEATFNMAGVEETTTTWEAWTEPLTWT